jgi:hypothetical protein
MAWLAYRRRYPTPINIFGRNLRNGRCLSVRLMVPKQGKAHCLAPATWERELAECERGTLATPIGILDVERFPGKGPPAKEEVTEVALSIEVKASAVCDTMDEYELSHPTNPSHCGHGAAAAYHPEKSNRETLRR